MRTEVRKARLDELEAFYAMRLHHYIAEIDGVAVAMGTLNRSGGNLWGWFDVKEGLSGRQRSAVVWAIMRGLRRIGQPVFVTSNEGVHDRAFKLIRVLGFRTTGEVVHGKQVWVWRPMADADSDPMRLENGQ